MDKQAVSSKQLDDYDNMLSEPDVNSVPVSATNPYASQKSKTQTDPIQNGDLDKKIQEILNNSVAVSVSKVYSNAKALQAQRKLDDKKFKNVRSKVGRNMKVIE